MASLFRGLLFAMALQGSALADDQKPLSANTPSNIPSLGFGTWNLRINPTNTTAAVAAAILTGYRHIDCAAIYGNEKEVGKGIADGLQGAVLKREDIWVTSKLWNDHHDPDEVEPALDKTLADLGLDYLNLYLMHWPVASASGKNVIDYLDTWHAMEALLKTGKTKRIGVSNFSPAQLKDLISRSSVRPYAHQFELHPYLQQHEFVKWHQNNSIEVTAYSPLANLNPIYGKSKEATPPSLAEDRQISSIAKKRGCTNAQVALKWGMARGTSVIPKSSHVERIKENIQAQHCSLEKEDFAVIDHVGKKHLKRFNNPSKSWGVDLYDGLDGA